jgi:hypothetical protein
MVLLKHRPSALVIALTLIVIAAFTTFMMVGCAKPNAAESAAAVNADRQILNEGYSMLYADATSLDRSELILYAKAESDAVEVVVRDVAGFGAELKGQLERIARDYPAVRIDLEPLPVMEQRKRRALGLDRARYFAPLFGHGGREYERTVLIGFSNGINHERHLCQVMAETEPDPNLKRFLLETEQAYGVLYERTMALLELEYFSDPDGKSGP